VIDLRDMAERVILGLVVWREARGESDAGRAGVAFSVLNRVARPTWWGQTVLSVCARKWQYSSMTDPHDPQLTRWPLDLDASWWECLEIAAAAIEGRIENPVPGADSYHDTSIGAPKWATPDRFVRQIGHLRFYNVDRDPVVPVNWP